MAKETQKAKIERLEKENLELREIVKGADKEIQKLKSENERLKKVREKKANADNLELIAQQLQNAENLSDRWHTEFFNEQQKNKRLEEEIQILKNEKIKKSKIKYIKENEELKKEIETRDETLKNFYSDKLKAEEEVKNIKMQQEKMFDAYKKDLEKVQEEYKNKSGSIKKHNERGAGRKSRFTDSEVETIKMYRIQGKTIKEISKLFKCSVGLIHKIINEK